MTRKTGQMSVHPSIHHCGVNIFKTIRLRGHLANIDETCHVDSMGPGIKLLGSGEVEF